MSWVPGNPGPKKVVESPVSNIDVWGAVKRLECTTTAIKAMVAMKRDTTTVPSFGGPSAAYLPGQGFMYTRTVSPIAVYEKCFEYGMRRGGAANYAGCGK